MIFNNPTIFLVFPSGFQEVCFIHSGLIYELVKKNCKLVILIDKDSNRKKYQDYFSRYNNIIVEVAKPTKTKRFSLLNKVTGILRWKNRNNISEIARQRLRKIHLWKKMALGLVSALFSYNLLLWLQSRLATFAAYDKLFLKYRPDLVILSDPGDFDLNRYLPRSAKKYGVPIIVAEHGIETPEVCTYLPVLDKACAWGEDMKDEFMGYHRYPEKNIAVTGLLRCDIYKRREFIKERNDFFKDCKLDPNKKLITIATTPSSLEFFSNLIKTILQYKAKGKIPFPIQIYLRPTPYQYRMKDYYIKEFLDNPLVYVGETFSFSQEKVTSREEIIHLVSLLNYTDIFINILSTLTLEAAFLDIPIINIAFDKVDSIFRYKYAQRIIESGGTAFVKEPQELIEAINEYLRNPDFKKDARRKLVNRFCYSNDGRTLDRVMNVIEGFLSSQGSRNFQ